jgi:hypothetical protein
VINGAGVSGGNHYRNQLQLRPECLSQKYQAVNGFRSLIKLNVVEMNAGYAFSPKAIIDSPQGE